jgi:hypothetical protein
MARPAYGGKDNVESFRSIDVLLWNRLGYLRSSSSSHSWLSSAGPVTLFAQRGFVVLRYKYFKDDEWIDVEQMIALHWTPCRFGGERPWFVCPGLCCGHSVRLPPLL